MSQFTNSICLMLIAVFTLSGCVPFPHFINITPRLSGKVVKSGQSLSEASLFFSFGDQSVCKPSSTVVKTNKDGSFFIARQSVFQLFYAPLVAPISVNSWLLCIEHGNQSYSGKRGINSQSHKQNLVLLCDLDKPHTDISADMKSTQSVCKVIESTEN